MPRNDPSNGAVPANGAVDRGYCALDRPVTALKGVGPKIARQLARLGMVSCRDLLFHLPLRYQDRTRVTALGTLQPGREAVVQGQVISAGLKFGRRRALLVAIGDGSGVLTLRFFHFSLKQQAALAVGTPVSCFGTVRSGSFGLEMVHPEYRIGAFRDDDDAESSLTPVYPATEGVGQTVLRGLVMQALILLKPDRHAPPDILDRWLVNQDFTDADTTMAYADRLAGFPALVDALHYVHAPPPDAPLALLNDKRHPAQRRLAFEELLAHYLSLRQVREYRRREAASRCDSGPLLSTFFERLPFRMTRAQQRVIAEIAADLRQGRPMQRLLQGDVGCGKTVVAAAAAVQVVEAGYQAALMVPTELLAEQHYCNFRDWLQPLGVQVVWLTGNVTGKSRTAVLAMLASSQPLVVVGTHALFQKDIVFARLGLVIIDEQHRFGVHQRLALKSKGRAPASPHQLVVTATPIPRTLAMTVYADLDVSVIDELPTGRRPVTTVVVPETKRVPLLQRVRHVCRAGGQVYWVCPLVEESEVLQCQAATVAVTDVAAALPDLAVGLVHGRMKPAEKDHVMTRFKRGEIDVLVATTVIEVGVDVPNATLMVIENAERLGLAQLHQLRGRVGRGNQDSHCVLMYGGRLSATARARLMMLRKSTNGFEIAREDLRIRGPGEVLGSRQTGTLEFRIADLLRDQDLFGVVRHAGDLIAAQYPQWIPSLVKRWAGSGMRCAAV